MGVSSDFLFPISQADFVLSNAASFKKNCREQPNPKSQNPQSQIIPSILPDPENPRPILLAGSVT
jgi:hypothetical protein